MINLSLPNANIALCPLIDFMKSRNTLLVLATIVVVLGSSHNEVSTALLAVAVSAAVLAAVWSSDLSLLSNADHFTLGVAFFSVISTLAG